MVRPQSSGGPGHARRPVCALRPFAACTAPHVHRPSHDDHKGPLRVQTLAAELDALKEERQILLKEREKRADLMQQNAHLEGTVLRLQQQQAQMLKKDPAGPW